MMKKRTLALLASLGLFAGLSSVHTSIAGAVDSIQLVVDDKSISTDTAPLLVHDRIFVPVRALSESLGATVTYDSQTDSATITRNDITLKLDFKSGQVWKNGVVLTLEESPRLVNDRAMVPVRFISEAFGNTVSYDDATQTVTVLPTQARLDERKNIQAVLAGTSQALQAKTSYSTDVDLSMDFPKDPYEREGALTTKYSAHLTLDTQVQTKLQHGNANLTTTTGHVKNITDVELYRQGEVFYVLNPYSENEWSKISNTAGDEGVWEGLRDALNGVSMSADQLQQFEELAPYASLKEEAATYTLFYHFDANGIVKLLKGTHLDQDMKAFDLTLQIDKATSLATGYTGDVYYDNSNPNHMVPSKVHAEGKVGNWDKVPTITIPSDVLKNAKSYW
ncbi:copper amine oxidase N-terminal domain-containing protein [Tumebacillus sp. ITR2]|uniref:Copper amine oxidase N-terminal domain-containing protein n=1 Tax=Tumebacillus amylolyticus TaxID=2801339 RepID=A0ABS1JE68_9BACL|nr:copper amine oxidase N-terminal domain-containing protein [Tumebacillus amylolyticus]MBL0388566.1 copper amine oxidase N-terminal domain-containing protein [Tumebacillus amylolyticus]